MAPETIVAHVNTYGAGAFFADLLPWLASDPLPSAPRLLVRFDIESRLRHIGLTLYRVDVAAGVAGDALAIHQVRFYPGAALPYGLSVEAETRASARSKLSNDTVEAGDRVSHFLAEGLVLVTAFRPGGAGLGQVSAIRLGPARRSPIPMVDGRAGLEEAP